MYLLSLAWGGAGGAAAAAVVAALVVHAHEALSDKEHIDAGENHHPPPHGRSVMIRSIAV